MDVWGWVYSLLFVFLQMLSLSPCMASDILKQDRFLHVQKPGDVLVSANGVFNAGFFPVGENAFCFSVWFSNSTDPNHTVVWMANRDQPVNGRGSKLELLRNGKLILTDAGRRTEWTVEFVAATPVQLKLLNTGNLVLQLLDGTDDAFLWQSFNSPTDTLLPDQVLTKDTYLISSRSRSNYSSGNYKLYFDNDNVLRLLYQVPNITSVYWPAPWLLPWENGSERSTYNSSRVAVLNPSGYFRSSDDLWVRAADLGIGLLRRLTLDPDGDLRLYSLHDGRWIVSWQSIVQPCKIHGICGQNSLCKYDHVLGRKCSCLPGYRIENPTDWSQGCVAEFTDSYDRSEFGFHQLTHVEFYGYDIGRFEGSTLQKCKELCLNYSYCKGFQFKYVSYIYYCYPKALLLNGNRATSFYGDLYLKLPKSLLCSNNCSEEWRSGCPEANQTLNKTYEKGKENGSVEFLLWFSTALGIVEFICIFLVWCILFRISEGNKVATKGYIQAATGFRRYTYSELKKATKNFAEEVGKGGAGVVYKGVLPDQRIAVIKHLHEAGQGEADFLAEVSIIGRLNHMNLIEMWGYCAEGKHRLLVYEYLEHGSLADNLSKEALNWARRFEIAVGTAKGLAYLHEECLERILHCDIKPQNILLDSNFQPKVADFGLSKLRSRGSINASSFSSVRGTRGYMAPEWVYNLPITSKVDVYSYGIVILEMVTGKNSTGAHAEWRSDNLEQGQERLVPWVREKINGAASREIWIEEVADPMLGKDYDIDKMKLLIKVAIRCVDEDMHARPTMSQVLEMLSLHDDEASTLIQGH